MAFFKELAALGAPMDYALSITIQADGKMKVTVRVMPSGINSKNANSLIPLSFDGTPDEFDAGLALAMKTPIHKTTEFFANCKDYERSLASATKKETELREQKQKELTRQKQSSTTPPTAPVNKEQEAKQKKFDAAMSKVSTLQTQGKVGQALAALPDPKEYADFKSAIEAKNKELRRLHSGFSLFDDPETQGISNAADQVVPDEPEDPKEPESEEPLGEDHREDGQEPAEDDPEQRQNSVAA